ncbi:hypothetical protein MAR_031146 [Mya arenaria]|uniref:Uncharacterized protein n=1 Tax=Mya arenaria TaxID=6604 RepID=A0ABY7F2Y4_MYAAR|nr:hypothetical protein MAR_031146 [Mya arenaria]
MEIENLLLLFILVNSYCLGINAQVSDGQSKGDRDNERGLRDIAPVANDIDNTTKMHGNEERLSSKIYYSSPANLVIHTFCCI